jgi:hypothetical protein
LQLTVHHGRRVWSLFGNCNLPYRIHLPHGMWSHDQRTASSLEVAFIDEKYTGKVHRPGVFVDEHWWSLMLGNVLAAPVWDDFRAAGPPVLTTTAGIVLGLLPLPAEGLWE